MSFKSYRTNVAFSLGLMTAFLDCVPVKVSGASFSLFSNVCPDCQEATKVNRISRCPICAGEFKDNELKKARKVGKDELVKLTAEEIDTINAAYVTRSMELQVCPAEEFVDRTVAGETCYRLRPDRRTPNAKAGYHLLKTLVENQSVVFYGKLKMDEGSTPKPYRILLWRDQLMLQSLVPPSQVDGPDEIDGSANPQHVEMARQLVAKMTAPFDAESLDDERIERINDILAARKAGTPIVAQVAPVVDDLMAALQKSLED